MKRWTPLVISIVVLGGASARADDLARARQLDQEGVRLYREGKYRDAMEQFRGARDAGGPPTELWNIARCHGKLGENKEEAVAIEKYLNEPGLSKDDRAEAAAELYRLQRLPSPLVVTSDPPGGRVKIDGVHVGDTPLSTNIAPGTHRIIVEHPRWSAPAEHSVDTVYGARIEWNAQGKEREGQSGSQRVDRRSGDGEDKSDAPSWLVARPTIGIVPAFGVGVMLPQYGSVGGSAHLEASIRALYAVWSRSHSRVLVGGRAMITGDSWSNHVGAPTSAPGCGLYNDQDATSFGLTAAGAFEHSFGDFRVGGDLGIGAGFFSASQVGGDLFAPSCNPGTKAAPLLHLGADLAYDFTRRLRLFFSPLMLDVSASYDGTRNAPKDASGAWLRFGPELGLAFEL